MYWNGLKGALGKIIGGWIVTLDVLKSIRKIHRTHLLTSWIVTLDVLKCRSFKEARSFLLWLNSNIRCIEIARY